MRLPQCIDQPGLPFGVCPEFGEDVSVEGLPCFGGVLAVKGFHFGAAEIAHHQRFCLDVESTAARDDFSVSSGRCCNARLGGGI